MYFNFNSEILQNPKIVLKVCIVSDIQLVQCTDVVFLDIYANIVSKVVGIFDNCFWGTLVGKYFLVHNKMFRSHQLKF